MLRNYGKIVNTLSHDPNVRVIILTAAGEKAFTAGLDIKNATFLINPSEGGSGDGARTMRSLRRIITEFQDSLTAGEKCLKPIITVYHGYSFGLAIDLGCATDIRLCTA